VSTPEKPAEPAVALAWSDGRIVPWADLTVHASALGTAQASSCFEGLRGYWSTDGSQLNVFRLSEHLRRLARSLKILRLSCPYSNEQLERAVVDLLSAVTWPCDVYLRVLAYEGSDVAGTFAPNATASILITAMPRPSKLMSGSTKTCVVSSWRRISDDCLPPRVKTVANYLNSRYAYLQATADGYDDAILLDQSGHVAEGSAACFFMVRDGVPITPPVTGDILESITRATLLELTTQHLGLTPVQRPIDRTELYIADEAFLCGTGGGEVTPVTSIDRYPVGSGQIGPVTCRIQQAYHDLVRAQTPYRPDWLTPVPAAPVPAAGTTRIGDRS
jgi:branched-chain amino acid aminotransferase